jgi:nickel-dependent lactate racemase
LPSSLVIPSARQLRTSAWYGDQPLNLEFPREWKVNLLWPRTPPPLADDEIAHVLERPVGQPPMREICRGKSRPLVIVDDLNRPTPAARVMPHLLSHFHDAGIPAREVRVLMGLGTHGAPANGAMVKKVGIEAVSSCRTFMHDCDRNVVKIGTTSFGTPVIVNREVVTSDFVVGIGGIYPNYTAGFGGGSKLALGVLGKRSIMNLHYRHEEMGWGSSEESELRRDLNEIAQMIHLNTMIYLHVDSDRQVVRASCGDPFRQYKEELAFSLQAFRAPIPDDADVVISNAYPNDLSLTFVKMKGITPLLQCGLRSSRIVIASCSEGIGHHGLFPFMNLPRFHRARALAQRVSVMKPGELVDRIMLRLHRSLQAKFNLNRGSQRASREKAGAKKNPVWLYRTGTYPEPLPSRIPFQIAATSSWSDIVQAVQREQPGKKNLKVLLYTCAPLQWLDPSMPRKEPPSTERESVFHLPANCLYLLTPNLSTRCTQSSGSLQPDITPHKSQSITLNLLKSSHTGILGKL